MLLMTGNRFKEMRDKLGLSLRDLASRWGVDPRTINREEKKDTVRELYADAIRYLKLQDESTGNCL
jgi:transcriptional regulator with XRE-family HTH domain